MVPARNVIVFGEPSGDGTDYKSLVIELLGAQLTTESPPQIVFETRSHSLNISKQLYTFYNTAGLVESSQLSLDPRAALGSLYNFTSSITDGVNLLIYVVAGDESTSEKSKNFKLFHDNLCQGGTPIILVTTNPNYQPPDRGNSKFKKIVPFCRGGDRSDSSKDRLTKAIVASFKAKPMEELPMDKFQRTTKESWTLLERGAGWSLDDCGAALKDILGANPSCSNEAAEKASAEIKDFIRGHYFRNVIVFGNTGAGKTSVIRMLTEGCEVDPRASSVGGSTFESKGYRVDIGGYRYIFHDTVGLGDATSSSMSPQTALRSLFQLITNVQGGVSLLVYVHRGRLESSKVDNYKIFNAICQGKVPIALVVTGLEEEESRGEWWGCNKHLFQQVEIHTEYSVCITSTKGKFIQGLGGFAYQEEYDESTKKLQDLFLRAVLPNPWKVKTASWLTTALVDVYKILARRFGWRPLTANPWLVDSISNFLDVTPEEAAKLVGDLESVISDVRAWLGLKAPA